MSNMDPVSDLLARIRNAHLAKHDRVDVPTSRLKTEVCRILKEEGFIRNFKLVESPETSRSRFCAFSSSTTTKARRRSVTCSASASRVVASIAARTTSNRS